MRVIDGSNGSRLLLETSTSLLIVRDLGWKYLDRDSAIQADISGPVDFAHPA
jgi:hypothetical protein